jgi:ATP-dependent Clp protease ATP-binding subunit ClpA
MKIYRYPLLCWKLTDDTICARVVGTEYGSIDTQLKKLQNHLADSLQQEYAEYDYLPEPLLEPRIKTINVSVYPSYEENAAIFPVKSALNIPVTGVYGTTEDGDDECYLPILDQNFYYYKQEQLHDLMQYFARDYFNNMPPEALHRYLMLAPPWLDEITIRVKPYKEHRTANQQISSKILQQVADRFPRKTKVTSIAPEVAWERSEIVNTLQNKIDKEAVSVVLIGDQGIGKTTILLEVARKIFRSNSKRYLWRTTPQRIIAGARYLGEWQENCEELMQELQTTDHILWINDFVHMTMVGGDGAEDSIAAFMLPNLRQGQFQIVAELTTAEWDQLRQRLPDFAAHFHVVSIPKLSHKQLFKITELFADYVEKQLHISIEKTAINLAYRLLERYIRYEAFPGKLIKFLTSCVNEHYINNKQLIDNEKVLTKFIEKSGLPKFLLRDDILLDKAVLHDYFAQKILGQEPAIERVAELVMIFKAGLNDPNKPIASLLFAGPTGVGKTACARALADYFFGQGQNLNPLIRLDMSEFQHPVQIERLLGTNTKPGKLIREVRERAFSVVLLDEIEKAHPIFFDILLNVMDEGILVDANGRVTDFRNVILIMTSNLGARQNKPITFTNNNDNNDIINVVKNFFRPEFYNRIDQVITFNSLDAATMENIIKKELAALNEREGFKERNLSLNFTAKLVQHLIKVGIDPEYGARPLQRIIERLVVAKLADFILQDIEIHSVDLTIDWNGESLTICNKLMEVD